MLQFPLLEKLDGRFEEGRALPSLSALLIRKANLYNANDYSSAFCKCLAATEATAIEPFFQDTLAHMASLVGGRYAI